MNQMLNVITVCKNDLENLKMTYESLNSQSDQEFSWIVIDSLSSDGTVEYLSSLDPKFNFNFYSEKDKGIYDGMNKGISKVHEGFIWFLNSGDICIDSSSISKIKQSLDIENELIIFQVLAASRVRKKLIGSSLSPYNVLSNMPVCHQGMIYSSRLFKSFGNYSLNYSITADHYHLLHLIKGRVKIRSVDLPIAVFALDGVSNKRMLKSTKQLYLGSKKVFGDTWFLPDLIYIWKVIKCFIVMGLKKFNLR